MLTAILMNSTKHIQFIDGFIGSALTSGVTSVTFTGHKVGDLLIAIGGSQQTADPTYTSGWTKITSFNNTNTNFRVGIIVYKFATSTASETLTFTGTGTSTAFYSSGQIFRNVTGIGASASISTAITGITPVYNTPALTLTSNKGSSTLFGGTYVPYTTTGNNVKTNYDSGNFYILNQNGNYTTAQAQTSGATGTGACGIVELLN